MGESSVRIEPSSVVFPPTYISSNSKFAVQLVNKSFKNLNYEWRHYGSDAEEKEALSKFDLGDPEQRLQAAADVKFQSEAFYFEPKSGSIWPEKREQIIVNFEPQMSLPHSETAYLYITETNERIPFLLNGNGLAPEAAFSISSINVGHINLDSILEYEVLLENIGQVGVDFAYEPRNTDNLIYEFTPKSGHIDIGSKIPIRIRFIANFVGSFSHTFTFKIRGCVMNHPTINLYGRVLGPTFTASTKTIAFGDVSYGFLYEKTFEFENKSDIPFDYTINLTHDGTFSRREFAISPQIGTLQKWSKQTIKIEFIPVSEQDYDLNLFIDIAKFAPKLVTIPITAKCICPPVSMENSKINLGNIFIGYHYQGSVKLKNDSPLPAKFEFIPASDSSQLQASIEVPRPNGVVPAEGTAELNFSIIPNQLGPLYIKQFVRIFGSSSEPIPFIVKAVCTGPNVEFSKNRIDFGTVSVLKNHIQLFKVTNNSLIDAAYTLEIKQDGTPFSIEPSSASIPPGQEINIDVIAYLDDTIKFAGKAIFTFANLNPISVDILANGQGNTIVPSIPISNIDLGYVFTEQNVIKKFTLTNKGRRVQEVRWLAQKPKVQGNDSIQVSFKIIPEVYTIEPGCTANYQLVFHCPRPCQFTMGLQCHGTLSKQRIELFNPQIKGTFIKPALWFSKQVVEFKHVHNSIKEEELTGKPTNEPIEPAQSLLPPIENTFEIKNTCKLPLSLNADIPEPFTMSATSFSLQPAESKTITVTFDPSIKTDYACEVINKKIMFNIVGHPQKNQIALKGQIVFPNIVFSPSGKIDFGILLMNTEQCKDITLKNPTELPVDFVWELLPQPDGRDTSSIFDIYPIRGHIEPFTNDVVHVSFFSKSIDNTNASYSGTCICHVIGGPDYIFKLSGGAADIQYKMEPQCLEFGNRGYLENVCVTNNLTNLSDVPINFAVKIPKGLKFQTFVVSPMEGILNAGQSVQFTIIAVAGLPQKYNESYFIQIGHFDEVRIDVNVNCFIPQAILTLSRTDDDPLKLIVEEIRLKKSMQKKPKTVRSITSDQTMTSRSGLEEEDDDYEEEDEQEDFPELERQQLVQKLSTRVNIYEISPLKKHRKKDEPVPLYEGFVASKFVIDMGNIVFGKKEVRKFNIKSITPFPISFEILDGNLEGTGFSIDPCSYKDIPTDIDLEVTVVFDTKMRTNDALGDVVYEIPVVFSEDYAYIIYLKANLSMPVLNFSQMHFDFGATIVGQAYVMTLQLQNMNSVSTEYKFGDAQCINVLQRAQQTGPPVFTASPSSGILPPASFQNIEISFQPQSEKSYTMQFPIEIKHNTQTSFITLKGAGVQLRVTFDPPELVLPPILPFSEPSSITVQMVNPTQYPIEVMAPQYDLQLLIESLQNKQPALPPTEIEDSPPTDRSTPLVTSTGNSNISKFSICVIVHGAPGSGRTTTSNDISQHLGIPVISLKTLWAEINKNPEATQADYVQAFSDAIATLSDGFVVDGLDGITKEPEETDAFLLHCIKTKNVWDDVQNNPFNVFKHDHLTAVEQALAYVIAALDGHYVFMVALRADEGTLLARQDALAAIERRKRRAQAKAEKERLFNMTEEQYMALSEEEQKQVDKKRDSYRRRTLRTIIDSEEGDGKSQDSSRRHRSKSSSKLKSKDDKGGDKERKHRSKSKSGDKDNDGRKSSRRHTKEEKDAPKEKEKVSLKDSKKASASKINIKKEDPKKKLRAMKSVPTDPIMYGIVYFAFTIGSLAARLRDGGELFAVIDPDEIKRASTNPTPRSVIPAIPSISSITQISPLKGKSRQNSQELILPEPPKFFKNINSLLLETVGKSEEISLLAKEFLPLLVQLKEKAFTRLIPPPRVVLPDPSTLRKAALAQMPQFFSIFCEEMTEEALDEMISAASSRSINTNNKRPDTTTNKGGRKSRTKKDRRAKEEPVFEIPEDVDLTKRTQRWQIEPLSNITLTISFHAQMIGEYKDTLLFSLLNAKADITKLRVCGSCNYPNIDRSVKTIFTKRVAKLDSKTEMAFVNDLNEYHFGSLLVVKERTGKTQPAAYHETLKLVNNSQFPAEITNFLDEVSPKSIWTLEPDKMTIKPGETGELVVGAHPVTPDSYKNIIKIYLKDNPDPLMFDVTAEGCAPIIDLVQTALDFDKMLLSQSKTLKLEMKNTGKLPAFWRLKNVQGLGTNFKFSVTEGMLNPRQSTAVSVQYSSNKPLAVKKAITFEVLDKNQNRVFISKNLNVSAESFDVNFDFQYPKGMDHLQFGSLKVSQSKTLSITLKNKGKYPSQFQFTLAPIRLANFFQISPQEGVLNPSDKPLQVNFTFASSKLVSFAMAKGITLKVIDSLSNTTTATLNIPYSAKTMFNAFKIEPQGKVDFGDTTVLQTVTKQITLFNTGGFPFEYDVQPKPEPVSIETPKTKGGAKKKPPARSPSVSKGRPKRGNEKSVTVGNFFVVPSAGTIPPNGKTVIDIDFMSPLPGDFLNTMLFTISDLNPVEYPGPIPIDLHSNSYIPGIVTHDFEKVFVGTHLCLRFDLPRTGQTAFLEDEQMLHFAPMILQQKALVPVTLTNPLPIPCTVDITLKTNTKSKAALANFPFDLSERTLTIDPNSTKTVQLSFTPVICDNFITQFEAVVRGGTDPETKALKFGVEGTGTLPQLTVLTQIEKPNKSGISNIPLGRTLIGFTKEKTITLSNEGLIPCRISVMAKATPDFELQLENAELTVEPGRKLDLPIIYAPQKVRKGQFDIGVNILDNPKANLAFSLSGEGFSEDVIFEGLPDDEGDLYFRDNVVGRQQQATFVMRNVSQNNIKFQWANHSDFSFAPRVGHLHIGARKLITVTFISDKPVKHNAVKVLCQWQKIEFEKANPPDWDDTMKVIKFTTRGALMAAEAMKAAQEQSSPDSKKNKKNQKRPKEPLHIPEPIVNENEVVKITEVKPEPANTPIPGKFKDLQIRIFAISDYIKYNIDILDISFSPTMMFQRRVVEVKVTNTCQIRFEYSWTVREFTALRTDYALVRKPPFFILPSSGFIEAGQSTTFKVCFQPEEVDDFAAKLHCDIPFLSQLSPPDIMVSGLSRRPLCHFNVEMSDYISSGRRHPDYSDPLPEDIKVIELFSKGIGQKTIKRFEVINPTSSSYEVNWVRSEVHDEDAPLISGRTRMQAMDISCDTPTALISSGKRYLVSFSYTPTSVRTVESQWEFVIPEHNVRVHFLIVGRIVPA